MIETSLYAASIGGAALLVVDGSQWALYGVLVTSVAGLIKGSLDKRAERLAREQEHRFALEDRAATAVVRKSIEIGLEANLNAVAENTALTRQGIAKATAALDTANHVNAKIANIAAAALAKDRAIEKRSTSAIRGDIADVREHQG